jgi:hypothetical protein
MSTAEMIERRWLSDWPDVIAAGHDIVDALRDRGARHFRLSIKEASRELVGEGWRARPDEEGELPM